MTLDEVRARHAPCEQRCIASGHCRCHQGRWAARPCDTAVTLEALAAAEAMTSELRNLALDRERQRDEARADAARLAEALESALAAITRHELATGWPWSGKTAADVLVIRAALAQHRERQP